MTDGDAVVLDDLGALLDHSEARSMDDLLDWIRSRGDYEYDVLSFPPLDDGTLVLGFMQTAVCFDFPVTLDEIFAALDDLHDELETAVEAADDGE